MPILWRDIENMVDDAREEIVRQRAVRDAAYSLALLVKADTAEDPAVRATLHDAADRVLGLLVAPRS